MNLEQVDGSYRDPRGYVFKSEDDDSHVYRTVREHYATEFFDIVSDNIIEHSISKGFLIETSVLENSQIPPELDASYLLKHQKIPFWSQPYEWTFLQLRDAALLHLNFQLFLLENGYTLSDASAYNIQFIGSKPIFIDVLSIEKYKEGQPWLGYKQFFEQFLNPLLLYGKKGIAFNEWYRGSLEGISIESLMRVLSLKNKLNWRVFLFLGLYNMSSKKIVDASNKIDDGSLNKKKPNVSKQSLISMLSQLRNWVLSIELPKELTVWGDYAAHNTYTENERVRKQQLIKSFVERNKVSSLLDMGCNSGEYSLAALEGGADHVVGFDFDHGALNVAYDNSKSTGARFLPLWLDAANPSPSQGWLQSEREGFAERFKADAVIALAFEHHLAIGKNIPLEQVVAWLVSLVNKCGLIEFVPKDDPTVQLMLSTREDIFVGYGEAEFQSALENEAEIVDKSVSSASGRILYEFKK